MELAARLAHLVGGLIWRVGRRVRSASAERTWLAPRFVVSALVLLMVSVGCAVGLGGAAAVPGRGAAAQHSRGSTGQHDHARTSRLADDAGNATFAQLG